MSKVNQPIVMTRAGQVMGKVKDGALLFCGIPYAAPPVADRRFKPAARVAPVSYTHLTLPTNREV